MFNIVEHFKRRVINNNQGFWPIVAAMLGTAAAKKGVDAYGRSQQADARKEAYVPEAPEYKQAPEAWEEALEWARTNFPNEFGARESALGDLSTPESATSYFQGFQPTSFEQALGNQHFANVWPGMEEEILGGLSKTGMEYSPLTAQLLGEGRGQIGFDIGSYLANQAEGRAMTSLDARLQADPRAMASPYLTTDINQSNLQTEGEWERALRQADIEYWKASEGAADRTANAGGVFSTAKSGIQAYANMRGAGTGAATQGGQFADVLAGGMGGDININRPSDRPGWNPPTAYNPNTTGTVGTTGADNPAFQKYLEDVLLQKKKIPTSVYR